MTNDRGPWIQTYTGKKFHVLDPQPEEIDLVDIAHSHALMPRFTGHTSRHYSIAEHSRLVAIVAPKQHFLHSLLHDASEAYICDIARPVKHHRSFAYYRKIEKRIQIAILEKFGCKIKEPSSIKDADNVVLGAEAICLMGSVDHPDWEPYVRAAMDHKLYDYLKQEIKKPPRRIEDVFLGSAWGSMSEEMQKSLKAA